MTTFKFKDQTLYVCRDTYLGEEKQQIMIGVSPRQWCVGNSENWLGSFDSSYVAPSLNHTIVRPSEKVDAMVEAGLLRKTDVIVGDQIEVEILFEQRLTDEERAVKDLNDLKLRFSTENILAYADVIAEGAEVVSRALKAAKSDGATKMVAEFVSSTVTNIVDALMPVVPKLVNSEADKKFQKEMKAYTKGFALKHPLIAIKAKKVSSMLSKLSKI